MIDVNGLVFTYPGAKQPAVNDLEFSVEDGEIFGFLGPNGAGKSTTQKVLTGLLRDYRGTVNVLERDSRDWGSELYEQVGVGFELPVHFGRLTARENLSYFASLYQGKTEDLDHLLDKVDLLDHADEFVGRYSKGMRVRLSFARAILCRPAAVPRRADHWARSTERATHQGSDPRAARGRRNRFPHYPRHDDGRRDL